MNAHTPEPPLRDAIAEAMIAIETFKNPNVDNVQHRLSAILAAAGLGIISRDKLDHLEFTTWDDGKEYLSITTSWSCRGCVQGDTKHLPAFILDADDPINSATLWKLQRGLSAAADGLAVAHLALKRAEEKMSDAETAIAKFTGSQP